MRGERLWNVLSIFIDDDGGGVKGPRFWIVGIGLFHGDLAGGGVAFALCIGSSVECCFSSEPSLLSAD